MTDAVIEKMEAEGIGTGTGPNYKPAIEARKMSSRGRSRRAWSNKTRRKHELLSDVEHNLFLALEWCPDVLDIREQFPIKRSITTAIAMTLGIPHPYYPKTNVLTLMTVDFLVTRVRNGEQYLQAYNAKRDEDSEDEESLARLEIMRTVFEESDIEHFLIYHSMIPAQEVENIAWIRLAMLDEREQRLRPQFEDHMARMTSDIAHPGPDLRLHEFCTAFDERHGLRKGTGLRTARMLMETRALIPDLTSTALPNERMSQFRLAARPGQLRLVDGSK
jgi:hypothetical protein